MTSLLLVWTVCGWVLGHDAAGKTLWCWAEDFPSWDACVAALAASPVRPGEDWECVAINR